ncbi:MAG: OmpA family protein [Alphaproteobacteria bacterium]|jgi:outer membrane protein OmpA-like peptidoglycan-associated protein|nr:OmpA family protein [Alphaproteobacteria bacterium]MDP6590480.1 OmpA family protein [Alphaproteobacteria bacterium]
MTHLAKSKLPLIAVCLALVFAVAACAKPEPPRLGQTLFVVVPDDEGKVGQITVNDGSSEIVLDSAYAAAHLTNEGAIEKADFRESDLDEIFSAALAAKPIPPSSFILYFEFGSDTFTDDSVYEFEKVFADIWGRQHFAVDVIGHTDTKGKNEYNAKLSLERAEAVSERLVARGIEVDTVSAIGRGEIDLLVDTPDDTAEARNRRVEITVR